MEKNIIKQYFRSGSRPTQEQFYALIDASYNENYSVYISAYELKRETGDHCPVKSIIHEAGKTLLVPWFKRINIPDTRTYHYSIPSCNLGPDFKIRKITMDMELPLTKTYEVEDKAGKVKINQVVKLSSIVFYNGPEAFLTLNGNDVSSEFHKEFDLDESPGFWKGISVDITVDYDIRSNIAVSDQFDITDKHSEELVHVFGGLGCEFKAAGQ